MAASFGIPVSEFGKKDDSGRPGPYAKVTLRDYLDGWSNQRIGTPARAAHHGAGFDLGFKEGKECPRTDGANGGQ